MDCVVHGVAKSQTRLSDFLFQALSVGMEIGAANTKKTVQRVLKKKKLKTKLLWDLAIPPLGMGQQALKSGLQSARCIPVGPDSIPAHVSRSCTPQQVCLRKSRDSMRLS